MRRSPLTRRTPLTAKSQLQSGDKPLERKSRLKPKSDSQSSKRKAARLEAAVEQAKAHWGEECIVCGGVPVEWHHAYTRGARPDLREDSRNLWPLCHLHHTYAQRGDHWLYWGLKECTDERLAVKPGGRLEPTRGEVDAILARWQEKGERRHVSPMGGND